MRSHMKKGGNAGGTIAGPVGGSRSGEVEKTQPVAKVVTPVRNVNYIVLYVLTIIGVGLINSINTSFILKIHMP